MTARAVSNYMHNVREFAELLSVNNSYLPVGATPNSSRCLIY